MHLELRCLRISILLSLGLTLGSQAGAQPVAAPEVEAEDEQAAEEAAERAAAQQRTADERAVAEGFDDFGLALLQRLGRLQSGNLVLAPLGPATLLQLAWAGARGETAAELARVLRSKLPADRQHAALGRLLRGLGSPGDEESVSLRLARRLWPRRGGRLQTAFLKIAREHYSAEPEALDFTKPEPARQKINSWIERQTEGEISELLPTGSLDAKTTLVLTDTSFFKGFWQSAFDVARTEDLSFRLENGKQVSVPTMWQRGEFSHGQFRGVQILVLPYLGERFEMLLLLPERVDGLPGLLMRLTAAQLATWHRGLREEAVEIYLPRFRLTAVLDLGQALGKLGLKRSVEAKADFSGLDGRRGSCLSRVFQQATIEVDELGTEASSATATTVKRNGGPAVFRADHPFLFAVRETTTGLILFLGRVSDPRI